MSNISFQVIPFAFLFIIILLFLSLKKNLKKDIPKQINLKNENFDEHKVFFEDAEKKLIALKELYKQELIDVNVYVKKTQLVAESINKLTGKNVQELIQLKKNDIYKELKNDIEKKIKIIPEKNSSRDLDKLISNVDKKIELGLNYERQ
tara:strand:- start:459 stop:905 length:447 start_codon:yes stop_codon:yes gene_type:complete